jgi:hypothetical protein
MLKRTISGIGLIATILFAAYTFAQDATLPRPIMPESRTVQPSVAVPANTASTQYAT